MNKKRHLSVMVQIKRVPPKGSYVESLSLAAGFNYRGMIGSRSLGEFPKTIPYLSSFCLSLLLPWSKSSRHCAPTSMIFFLTADHRDGTKGPKTEVSETTNPNKPCLCCILGYFTTAMMSYQSTEQWTSSRHGTNAYNLTTHKGAEDTFPHASCYLGACGRTSLNQLLS